jgi:hypothetical protein
MRKFPLVLFIALSCPVSAEPIDPGDIRVIDGDTIRVYHEQPDVRLVGFNAPETQRAACEAEALNSHYFSLFFRYFSRLHRTNFSQIPQALFTELIGLALLFSLFGGRLSERPMSEP